MLFHQKKFVFLELKFSFFKDALQADLNSLRSDYDQAKSSIKELKKHHHHHHSHPQTDGSKSPSVATNSLSSRLNLSPFNSSGTPSSHTNYLNQENENLEEDMRKAKESADMLRSVVLPLETEINTLRSRSNTSEKRIKELEKIIDEVTLF